MPLMWSNPKAVDIASGVSFLYFIRVVESNGDEYRYIGKATIGVGRLKAYCRNVERIFARLPRRRTVDQQKYRAVHLALAKACEHDWMYEFYPLENVPLPDLSRFEMRRIHELGCRLNSGNSWEIAEYEQLRIADLLVAA